MQTLMLLIPLFFLTAIIYSSVGFGGGSTYLALLALAGYTYQIMPQVALVCNLVVVSGGVYRFTRAGFFSWREALPFVLTSIPFSYLGGSLLISKRLFSVLLVLALLAAGLRLLIREADFETQGSKHLPSPWAMGLLIGAVLGFLSGLLGIGGGIFLSPILFLLRWGNARKIAAMASFFIFVNSCAGLLGQLSKTGFHLEADFILPLALAVFAGGQIGNRLSLRKMPAFAIQRMTAVLILVAAAQIAWKAL